MCFSENLTSRVSIHLSVTWTSRSKLATKRAYDVKGEYVIDRDCGVKSEHAIERDSNVERVTDSLRMRLRWSDDAIKCNSDVETQGCNRA